MTTAMVTQGVESFRWKVLRVASFLSDDFLGSRLEVENAHSHFTDLKEFIGDGEFIEVRVLEKAAKKILSQAGIKDITALAASYQQDILIDRKLRRVTVVKLWLRRKKPRSLF